MLKFRKNNLLIFILGIIFLIPSFVNASISCSITTQEGCSGITILRMSGSENAHAELPNQSTPIYDSNVVCCTGPSELSNSCNNTNKVVVVRMSGVTNAHVEENTQTGVNYTENVCLSSTYDKDEITLGYKLANCAGYDETLFSMSSAITNSQVGIPSAYVNKVCVNFNSKTTPGNSSGYYIQNTFQQIEEKIDTLKDEIILELNNNSILDEISEFNNKVSNLNQEDFDNFKKKQKDVVNNFWLNNNSLTSFYPKLLNMEFNDNNNFKTKRVENIDFYYFLISNKFYFLITILLLICLIIFLK